MVLEVEIRGWIFGLCTDAVSCIKCQIHVPSVATNIVTNKNKP